MFINPELKSLKYVKMDKVFIKPLTLQANYKSTCSVMHEHPCQPSGKYVQNNWQLFTSQSFFRVYWVINSSSKGKILDFILIYYSKRSIFQKLDLVCILLCLKMLHATYTWLFSRYEENQETSFSTADKARTCKCLLLQILYNVTGLY